MELKKQFEEENSANAATKASLVGAIAVGATFFLSPVSAMLTDRYGIRKTAISGGLIATLGMLLSSFCLEYASGFEVSAKINVILGHLIIM